MQNISILAPTICLLLACQGSQPYKVLSHSRGLSLVAFSSDGKVVHASETGGGIVSWSVSDWKRLVLNAPDGQVVTMSRDGAAKALRVLFKSTSNSRDEFVYCSYDGAAPEPTLTLPVASDGLYALSPDNKTMSKIDFKAKAASLRDLRTNRYRTLDVPSDADLVTDLQFSPDGKQVSAVFVNNVDSPIRYSLAVWSTNDLKIVARIDSAARIVDSCFSDSSRFLVFGKENGEITVVRTSDWSTHFESRIPDSGESMPVVLAATKGDRVFCGSMSIQLLDLSSRAFRPAAHFSKPATDIAVSPDGRLLAAVFDYGVRTVEIQEVAAVTDSLPVPPRESWKMKGHRSFTPPVRSGATNDGRVVEETRSGE